MFLEYFSIVFKHLPTIHARLPRSWPQENNDIDILKGCILLHIGVNLNRLDSDIAAVLQLHLDNLELRKFLLNFHQPEDNFDISAENVWGAEGVVKGVGYFAGSTRDAHY